MDLSSSCFQGNEKFPSSPEVEQTHSAGKFKARIQIYKPAHDPVQHLPFLPVQPHGCAQQQSWGHLHRVIQWVPGGSSEPALACSGQSCVCGGYYPPVRPTAPSKPVRAPLTNEVGGSRHSLEKGEESSFIFNEDSGLLDPVLSKLAALKRSGNKEE